MDKLLCDECESEFDGKKDSYLFQDYLCPKCEKLIEEFWENETKNKEYAQIDVTDIPITDFVKIHYNVLKLIETKEHQSEKSTLAHILTGKYYLQSFESRSQSNYIATICKIGDYLSIYCGSSRYVDICFLNRNECRKYKDEKDEKLFQEFEIEDTKDRENRIISK
jgi:hypothetical protein